MKKNIFVFILIIMSCNSIESKKQADKMLIAESNNNSEQKFNKAQYLYDFIGLDFNSDKVKNYVKEFGEFKYNKDATDRISHHYENAGINLVTDERGEIVTIFCFNKNERLINKPVRFSGNLPFDLTFDDNLQEVHNKIGEGSLFHRYGFYGRTFVWTIQDSLKISMVLELPREESEKIFIEQISLWKIE